MCARHVAERHPLASVTSLVVALAALAALAIIWLGYPVVVRLLGGLRAKRAVPADGPAPAVSVVLATNGDAGSIRARVANLLGTEQPGDLIEVIVALDAANAQASPDELADLEAANVRIVAGDAPGGKAATLNAGVRAARNPVLVFADTAQRFAPDSIPALVAGLADARMGAVSGMLELPGAHGTLNLAERYWRLERWLRKWEARLHSSVGVTGAIYAMRRELWKPLPANLILDDVYLPMRLVLEGWRVGFTERAKAQDVRRFEAGQEYRRKVRTLTGVIQVCAWLPGVLNPVRNPLWLQFVFHKLLRLLTPWLAVVALVAMAWAMVSTLLSTTVGTQLLLALAVAGVALCLVPGVRRALRHQIAWGVAMQSSIVVATVNGVRGRWDVWR
jgi:cellulose synthase/poly-beta-1,6-N-acetylglucosamine synthase-like glycosyltransferase